MNNFLKSAVSLCLAFGVILAAASIFSGCSTTLSRTFLAADTTCTITLYDGEEKTLDKAVELVTSLASKLNCKDESSEIGMLNKEKVCRTPSAELLEIINKGIYYSSLREGIFDITVKPLSDLWDFKKEVKPQKNTVEAALKKVGYKNISVKSHSITLKMNAEIDLGAIAKGYIADKTSEFLIKNGVTSALINLGGNITVLGQKSNEDFLVGIQTPFSDGTSATVRCSNMSVVTSGVYQRYFEKDGVIYHHLLDTKTGEPVQNGLHSVTIITESATSADALSTLCFLLGRDEGMAQIEALDNTEAVFIDSNNKLHLTSGLKNENGIISVKNGF